MDGSWSLGGKFAVVNFVLMVNQQKELPRRLARQNGDYYLVSVTAKTLKIG